jgi:hypothetical protein
VDRLTSALRRADTERCMTERGGLDKFGPRLHPDVVAEIGQWAGDPALHKLHAALQGHTRSRSFLDTFAEAMIARHLRRRGCELGFEIPTPSGKACDFEVGLDAYRFYLHVKRVDTQRPARKKLTISSRLRSLERIKRPYVVGIRWHEDATDEHMQRLVRSATDFIGHARVGDELVVHAEDGTEIGGVLIVAPWEGPHVTLVIGLPSGFIDEAPRMRKLMQRAYKQFMPRADNLILLCSSQSDDSDDFESALLGSHVERWDSFPPRGRRIAHGRAADGFWSGERYIESRAAGWFRLDPAADQIDARLWLREDVGVDARLRAALREVFLGDDHEPAG